MRPAFTDECIETGKIKMEEKSFVTHSLILASYCSKRTITSTTSTRIWMRVSSIEGCFKRSFRSIKVDLSEDKSQFSPSVLNSFIKSVWKYLAWQWIKERRKIYICIESQFLSSLTLLSKPLPRSNWTMVSNSRTKQPSIELTRYRESYRSALGEMLVEAAAWYLYK